MQRLIGLGVAGNVAGHLEQAGEASDFVNVAVADADGPKGIFPFHVPGAGDHYLATDPVSSDTIVHPGAGYDLQIEPEVGLWCEVEYRDGRVVALRPTHASAHNDCSVRRPPAPKISRKKNWGAASKGVAKTRIAIDRFDAGGVLDAYRIASYLYREGSLHAYGVDSPLLGYTYFHGHLLDWLVKQMNEQRDEGPLESIQHWLTIAGHPRQALISIGATRYTEYGESTYLAPGDRAIVVLYDARIHGEASVAKTLASALGTGSEPAIEEASLLIQTVRAK